ncbi:MAG: penicillin-binding transpeptidase domain-containing protein [Actinomycetota bacterium]|nr:penicillin-binding transpeptidase domain-containing protein [Actinomycetota bacterium]
MTVATRGGGLAGAVAVLLIVAGACSEDFKAASAAKAANTFITAWNGRDAAAMLEAFDDKSAQQWTAPKLERWLTRALQAGAVETYHFDIGSFEETEIESEDELSGARVRVPLDATYDSSAVPEPIRLDGSMNLVYQQGWKVEWDEGLMWPGIEGAAGFVVDLKDAIRGPIVDRNGKVLARGQGSDRRYPYGSTGGSTIGHIAPVTKKEAKKGLSAGDFVGAAGLEEGLNDVLTAAAATDLVVVDEAGEKLEVLGSKPAGRPEKVQVTLDIEMQRAAENAYGGTTGGAVVIEPATGDLLAIVSSAPFDPNNYVGVAGITPFNRALSGTYPPGSAMKVVTASAALDTGTVKPTTTVTGPGNYKGVHNFDSGEFGSIPFSVATQNSVNTAYAQVAEDLGGKKLTEYAERFGFNKEPTMPLEAATPSFPPPEDLSDLMWSAIGQAQVLATPLQMATIAATVANKGIRMEPRIVLDAPTQSEEVMTRKSARTMTELMELVVRGGTGTAANLGTPSVAGKTGTAEVNVGGGILNHAWFICFAPSDDPEVAVAVVSEFGGVGGEVAAPLARQILQAVLPLT